jgi:hypothetical protein
MLAGIVAAAALPAAAHGAVRPPADRGPLGNELLSNERTVTRWAYPRSRGKIRTAPRRSARSFARLRFLTELHATEVYLVLRSRVDRKGRVWIQIRVPMRPNGRKGWVPRSYLHEFRVNRDHLRVNRRTLRATFYRDGRVAWTSPVGIGTPSTPTPAGRFYIRERIPNGGGNSAYGPWALGTSAYAPGLSGWDGGGVIGIHGTNQPQLIPGRPSHGCVRVPNAKISRLARLIHVGTPVTIL